MKNEQTSIYAIAKKLRQKMTPAEKILWEKIRSNKLGVKFRRQEAFIFSEYRYVADFCCHQLKLIIEIDGGYHDDKEIKELDEFREDVFKNNGYNIIRFTNNEVLNNTKEVINKTKNIIQT